ncbi:hypothetical protein [Nitrosovibrio tenuis]|nr:hypothetical protein [Nitrosovibrio tenuis]
MTELEKIEFNRRIDIAYSVIEAAARCFGLMSDLDERIKSAAKAASSYWYWFFIIVGIVMHYSPSYAGSGLNTGIWVIFATLGVWCAKQFELRQLKTQRDGYEERLYELEMIWRSVVGTGAFFWDIDKFTNDGLDHEDDAFSAWWAEQRRWILERVCGYKNRSF